MARDDGRRKIAIVTVHGTNDSADSAEGQKWFQKGSHFSETLKQRLAQRNIDAEITPFLWSGANSASARERGADELAKLIKRIAGKYRDGVHLVGHSHGGNVANEAAVLLRWGRRKTRAQERIASLTTIGTPFLNARTGPLQAIAGFLFTIVAWLSVPLYALITLMLLLWAAGDADLHGVFSPELGEPSWVTFSIVALLLGLPLAFMLRLAIRGFRRIFRPTKIEEDCHAKVFSVWHANDEAISFLQKIEQMPLEPFPRGALFRGSRGTAVSAGVLAVIVSTLAPSILLAMGRTLPHLVDAPSGEDWYTYTGALLYAAPLVFIATYILVRLGMGGGGEVVARDRLNGWIAGVLRGIAFGRDGDQRIGEVNTRSHTLFTREHRLDGPAADRMQANAAEAASKLIDTYRWSLFTVGADTNGPLAKLATDAMTWDSLIHTTYFDQPEVIDLIADYIGDEVGAANPVAAAAE